MSRRDVPRLFYRKRRTSNMGFRLSCLGGTLFVLTIISAWTGNTKFGSTLISGRRLSDFECGFNTSGICENVDCVNPDDFPLTCCVGDDPESVADSSACLTEHGEVCDFDQLCVAELIPGGAGAAECLQEWEYESAFGIIIYTMLLLYLFLAIAIVADDYFTASLDRIGEGLGLSEDVNGATFAAAGSSAPELFVSLADNVIAQTPKSIGIGTIIGSAIFNILVIIGLSALLAKLPENSEVGDRMLVDWRPIARDSFFYSISIIALALVAVDGSVEWYEGLVLTILYGLYIVFMVYNERFWECVQKRDRKTIENYEPAEVRNVRRPSAIGSPLSIEFDEADEDDYCAVLRWPVDDAPDSNRSWIVRACTDWDMLTLNRLYYITVLPINLVFRLTIPDSNYDVFKEDKQGEKENRVKAYSVEFIMCVVWIAFLSHMLVFFASKFGCLAGIPPEVMGLTILAAGTSVPDAITSIIMARNGQYNMAIANSIGSNVFDILLGLGFPWFLANLKNGTPIILDVGDLIYSVSFLYGVLLLLLLLLKCNGFALSTTMGMLLCVFYGIYVLMEVLKLTIDGFSTRIEI